MQESRAGRRAFVLAAVLLAVLGLVPVANLLSGRPFIPWWSRAVSEWLITGPAVLVAALVLARLLGARVDAARERLSAVVLAPSPHVFMAIVAGVTLVLTVAFAAYCFSMAPFSQDEMAQQFQARLLLAGRLFARAEPHPEFILTTGVGVHGGRWFSMYPIGGPALLAAGLAVHAPWLVNPLLTALTAALLYRFAAAAFGEGTGRASALLFACSPFVLIMGASQMNHAGTLACATLALLGLTRWTTSQQSLSAPAALIGLGVGGMAAIRPLDAVAVGLVLAGFQAAVLVRDRSPHRWRSLAVQVVAGALPVLCLLYANARTTGDPLLFAYDVFYGPGHRPGFHADPYGVPHTPTRAVILTSASLMRLNRYLFEWPLPGLVPIVAAMLSLRSPGRWDGLLLGLMAAVLGAYALYWFDGFFAGPRFLYTAVPAFIVLAARAPGLVADRIPGALARRAVALIVPLCLVWAWAVPTGVSSVQARAYLYHSGRTKLKTDIAGQVAAARLDRALVFVHEGWRARLETRLRANGLTPAEALRLLDTADACRIQSALDAEDTAGVSDGAGRRTRLLTTAVTTAPLRPVPGLQADQSLLLTEGSALTARCQGEIAADSAGDTPFAPFLSLARFDTTGALGGPAVFVRDFGPRNALVRTRFPDRSWFRYVPRRALDDPTPAIVPYQ